MSVKKTNVIQWTGAGPDDIVWQYPYEDIRWGSIVTVNEHEKAIFLRDGKIYDVFEAGRHVLTTQNVPLLTRAFRLLGGYGETPFKANIIFISTKQHKGRFGAETRVRVAPNSYYATPLQTFGEFWLRVKDPTLFLTQMIGSVSSISSQDITNFLRAFFQELLLQELSKHTAVDVYAHLTDVTARIKTGTVYEAFLQRGLELLDLKIAGVSLPKIDAMEDDKYGFALSHAIQSGDANRVHELTKTVESMKALGKSQGAGLIGALFAVPSMLGASGQHPQYPQTQQQSVPQGSPSTKSSLDQLRELKQMLDEGLITVEDYEKTKKEILDQMKNSES